MTDEEAVTRYTLQAELDDLEAEYAEAPDMPEEIDRRLGEIGTAPEALDDRPSSMSRATSRGLAPSSASTVSGCCASSAVMCGPRLSHRSRMRKTPRKMKPVAHT